MQKRDYLVSVVTPFHNAKPHLFERCVESMRAQTMGFENIQWVIALHNSEEEYVASVRGLCGGLPNVTVFELYNDHRTASSPRNACMEHVAGKYVFFLDADDFLFPYALEQLVAAMEEHAADIGSFREESLVGSEGLQLVDNLRFKSLLDQTVPIHVLHRNSPEMAGWIDPRNGTVHKMYRVGLLREHGIAFEDEVRIGEDITFNLRCLRHADTVVFLPQLIGYGYVMNAGSLAQSVGKEENALMTVLVDSLAWVEASADSGLDASNVAWIALVRVAKALSAPGVPPEIVDAWKPRFAPYADSFPPLKGNAKWIFSEEAAQGVMALVRGFFAGGDAAEVNDNEKLLHWILSQNAATEIGLKCRFDRIRSYEAYKQAVPMSDYSFYAPLVELTTRIGEVNIFSAEAPAGYSLTSGATGPAKLVPYTARHLRTYMDAMRDVLAAGEPTFALFESLPNDMEYVDGGKLDSIVGATLSAIRLELVDCSYAKRFKQGAVTSPAELLFPDEVIDPRYPRLLFALLDRDVSQVAAPFTWVLLDTMQFLEKHHARLADDIERGEITYTGELPEGIRAQLEAKLNADPERAGELREAFACGFEGIVGRIWPKCRRVVTAGTGPFSLYTRKLAFYTGDIPLDNGYLAASEAVVGRSMGPGTGEYALLTDNAFFEFLEPGADEPVMAAGVEPGKCYELILTNAAGLYRYRLGDAVQIERIESGVPVFTYAYRADEVVEVGGATVTEDELEAAALAIEDASGADIRDFCAMEEDGRLVILVEPASDPGELDRLLACDAGRLGEAADVALAAIDEGYRRAREAGEAGAVQVRVLEPETQLAWRDRKMFLERTAPDQLKPVRVLDDEDKRRFFTALTAGK
ncbi:MAG: GH3 auxin-responsive promoter family protein [Eggerthellaceae bacterium]|nr:GH3 auxin-responsive promoter family protein [Eggerthellaceae bacterium]